MIAEAADGMMTIREVAAVIGGEFVGGNGGNGGGNRGGNQGGNDSEFLNVNTDSRRMQQGDLFVALKGERFDGHDFATLAVFNDTTSCKDNFKKTNFVLW